MTAVFAFKKHAHQYADGAGIPAGTLMREYMLFDFLNNNVDDDFTAFEVAEEALVYFCTGKSKQERVFQFAVMTVCFYLHQYHCHQSGIPPQQPIADLVAVMSGSFTREMIQNWMQANFA